MGSSISKNQCQKFRIKTYGFRKEVDIIAPTSENGANNQGPILLQIQHDVLRIMYYFLLLSF